ncbi:MAG: P1 family peptidase [Coriobacteriia bacterium]|nr:P1 family peptidase [Coriobacteriia bacterium]
MPTIKRGSSAILPQGVLLGHQSNKVAATGCTVVLCPDGAVGSVAVRGGAPATRETDLLAPENLVEQVHAVLISGGSAFGLDAASGVMQYLEEKSHGFSFGQAVVPIVVGASLFDLDVGSATIRPDASMGYAAAASASECIQSTGNVGAGTGASVGRFLGSYSAMKGGVGIASTQVNDLLVSAVVAVNSLGNVFDRVNNRFLAGARIEQDGVQVIAEPTEVLPDLLCPQKELGKQATAARTNTTIGVVITNATLCKAKALRAVSMAHDGLARTIYPAHTSFDGDALFALATGKVPAEQNVVGMLAALAVEQAILDAVTSAKEAYGLPSAHSFLGKKQ